MPRSTTDPRRTLSRLSASRWLAALAHRWRLLGGLAWPGDAPQALRVAVLGAAVTSALRLRRDAAVLRWLSGVATAGRPADPRRIERIVRCTDAVLGAGRPLLRSECLTRSIVLAYELRRAGMHVDVAFGATTREGTGLMAHCWLEHEGTPVFEAGDPREQLGQVFRLGERSAALTGTKAGR